MQMPTSGAKANPFSKANVWAWESAKISWWMLNLFPFCGRLRLNLHAQVQQLSTELNHFPFLQVPKTFLSCEHYWLLGSSCPPQSTRRWNACAGPELGTHEGDMVEAGEGQQTVEPIRMRWEFSKGFPNLCPSYTCFSTPLNHTVDR